jgi:archaellum component FlaC
LKDTEKQIVQIREKLRRLIKQYTRLQKDNDLLKGELKISEEKISAQQYKLDEMKQQVSLLKLNSQRMHEPDKKEFEKILSKYIRDIDRCIALLND